MLSEFGGKSFIVRMQLNIGNIVKLEEATERDRFAAS